MVLFYISILILSQISSHILQLQINWLFSSYFCKDVSEFTHVLLDWLEDAFKLNKEEKCVLFYRSFLIVQYYS